jgi:hypothetical protein
MGSVGKGRGPKKGGGPVVIFWRMQGGPFNIHYAGQEIAGFRLSDFCKVDVERAMSIDFWG